MEKKSYVARKDVTLLYKISEGTLKRYEAQRLLHPKKIKGRVFYDKEEIFNIRML